MRLKQAVQLFSSVYSEGIQEVFMFNEDNILDALDDKYDEIIETLETDMDEIIVGVDNSRGSICLNIAMTYFNAVWNKILVDNANGEVKLLATYYEENNIDCVTSHMACCYVSVDNWLNSFNLNYPGTPPVGGDPGELTPIVFDGVGFMELAPDVIEGFGFIIS